MEIGERVRHWPSCSTVIFSPERFARRTPSSNTEAKVEPLLFIQPAVVLPACIESGAASRSRSRTIAAIVSLARLFSAGLTSCGELSIAFHCFSASSTTSKPLRRTSSKYVPLHPKGCGPPLPAPAWRSSPAHHPESGDRRRYRSRSRLGDEPRRPNTWAAESNWGRGDGRTVESSRDAGLALRNADLRRAFSLPSRRRHLEGEASAEPVA